MTDATTNTPRTGVDFTKYETGALLSAAERCIETTLDVAYANSRQHHSGKRVINKATGADMFTATGDEFSAVVKELRRRIAAEPEPYDPFDNSYDLKAFAAIRQIVSAIQYRRATKLNPPDFPGEMTWHEADLIRALVQGQTDALESAAKMADPWVYRPEGGWTEETLPQRQGWVVYSLAGMDAHGVLYTLYTYPGDPPELYKKAAAWRYVDPPKHGCGAEEQV